VSEWKVFADRIEIFDHPNASKLSLGRVGSFQVVVGKGLYQTGDIVVFAPKRSILPPDLRTYYVNEETGHSYLKGVNEDWVGSIRLRGEESEGAILPWEWIVKVRPEWKTSIPMEVDLSGALGITEYIPGVPSSPRRKQQQGDVIQLVQDAVQMDRFVRHDAEQFRIFQNEFIPGEFVSVTEKIHGSQISIMKDKRGRIAVTSKGRALQNYVLREFPLTKPFSGRGLWNKIRSTIQWLLRVPGPMNEYWKVAYDSGIIQFLKKQRFEGQEVQLIGEVIPFQKGFTYGCDHKHVLIFRVIVGTIEEPYGAYTEEILWVPQLYYGPYDPWKILPLCKGKETVSGMEAHIREGVVLTPAVARRAKNGTQLIVKIVNPAFTVNDEDPT
jgi:RNA ligase (TIGR02306 family)